MTSVTIHPLAVQIIAAGLALGSMLLALTAGLAIIIALTE